MFLKSNVKFKSPIEQINRKLTQRKNTCSASKKVGPVETEAEGWIGCATFTAGRAGLGITKRNYLVVRSNAMLREASAGDLSRRLDFVDANKGKNIIKKDLMQYTPVTLMYEEAAVDSSKTCNGVSAKGYTLWGWVMAVQYAGLKNSRGGQRYDYTQFPTQFDA